MCQPIAIFPRLTLAATLTATLITSVHSLAQTRWDGIDDRSRWSGPGQTSNDLWGGSNWLDNGRSQNSSEWRLGVQGDNTQVGVRVREVQPNSAADRARIEPGDVIVAVGGFQVGMVDGRLYDLTEEVNRRADANGNVAFVIQDHRNYGLASVRIQLDSSQRLLAGTIINRQLRTLPTDAIVTVQIENVSRPHYSVRNGQTRFRPQSSTNIPFEINYDPAYIDPQDTYQVRAIVTSGGRMILNSPARPVLTRGHPEQALLELTPLNSSSGSVGGTVTAAYPNYNDVDDQLIRLYRRYLRREPTFLELAALRATPGIANHIRDMPLELMAAQEYFDAAGNNNSMWLEKVFQEIVQRRPTQSEHQQWMQRYADLRFSRTELLRQLNSQAR